MTVILNAEKPSKTFKLEEWCGEKRVIGSDLPFENSTVPKLWRTHCWEGRTKADELSTHCSKWCKSKSVVKTFGHFPPWEPRKNTLFPRENLPSIVEVEGSQLIEHLEGKIGKT